MKRNARTWIFPGAALGAAVALASCGGGGGAGDPPPPMPPAAPVVSAVPGNNQATLGWSAVTGATSYNVYTSATSPVTTADAKTSASAAGSTLPALTNGTPVFAAVTTVGSAGESPLSNEVCAVPTAASTSGVSLYDAFCASAFDGARWQTPLFSRSVVNGAMQLSSQAANMEALASRGLTYATTVPVNEGGQRVTALQASVTVPAASTSRSGAARVRASMRLVYQPPAGRWFPVDNQDLLFLEVGLLDNGSGLRAFRNVAHCDTATCAAPGSSGVTFVDPAGFPGDAPAAYDTAYTATAALDEASGLFSWSIKGGGLDLSGTADPAAYLAGNAGWAAVGPSPLVNGGFVVAGPRTTLLDDAGGSSGRITARFDDVKVGLNNAPAAAWDDFSAAGGNSGPTELSAAKWRLAPGMNSMTLAGGSLVGHAQATTPTAATLQVNHALLLRDPASINTLQADFTPAACSNTLFGTLRIGLGGSIYNNGSPGTTPPDVNQAHSRVGDVVASLFIDCFLDQVRYQVTRFDTNAAQTILGSGVVPSGSAPMIGTTHTLRMRWDPATHLITYQADGAAALVVDPTTVNANMTIAAPFIKAPNVPEKTLSWFLFFPASASAGATASIDFKANNVFTAP